MSWPALVLVALVILSLVIACIVLAVKNHNRTQALAQAKADLAVARKGLEKAALLMAELAAAARQEGLTDAQAVEAMLGDLARLQPAGGAGDGDSPGPDPDPDA